MFKNEQSDSDDERLIVDAYESKTMPKSMQQTKKTAYKSTKPCKGVPLSHAERRAACQRLIDERKKKEEQDAKDAMAALEDEEEEEEEKADTEDEEEDEEVEDKEEKEEDEEVEDKEEKEEKEEDEEVEDNEEKEEEEEEQDTEDPEETKDEENKLINHKKIEIVNALAAIARPPTTVKPTVVPIVPVVPVVSPFIPQRMVLNNGIDHNNVRIVITIQNGQTEVSFR
jgi:hypothetical protein